MKTTFWACLDKSGLKIIFHLRAHSYFLKIITQLPGRYVKIINFGKKNVVSANNLASDSKPSGRLLIYIKDRRGPTIDPCGTPANMGNQSEVWLLIVTLWYLLLKKLWRNLRILPVKPIVSPFINKPFMSNFIKSLWDVKKTWTHFKWRVLVKASIYIVNNWK